MKVFVLLLFSLFFKIHLEKIRKTNCKYNARMRYNAIFLCNAHISLLRKKTLKSKAHYLNRFTHETKTIMVEIKLYQSNHCRITINHHQDLRVINNEETDYDCLCGLTYKSDLHPAMRNEVRLL